MRPSARCRLPGLGSQRKKSSSTRNRVGNEALFGMGGKFFPMHQTLEQSEENLLLERLQVQSSAALPHFVTSQRADFTRTLSFGSSRIEE